MPAVLDLGAEVPGRPGASRRGCWCNGPWHSNSGLGETLSRDRSDPRVAFRPATGPAPLTPLRCPGFTREAHVPVEPMPDTAAFAEQ